MEQTNPTLDFDVLACLTEEERAAALDEYKGALFAAAKGECKAELDASRYEATKYRLALDSALPNFNERIGAIEEIIAGGDYFAGMSDEDKLRTAYYIDRGKNALGKPSTEELIASVRTDSEAMRVLECELIEKLRAKSNPKLGVTSGNASLPLTPKAKPKTLTEAAEMAREAFGI